MLAALRELQTLSHRYVLDADHPGSRRIQASGAYDPAVRGFTRNISSLAAKHPNPATSSPW